MYKEIIKKNWKSGSEEIMNKSVDMVAELLEEMKEVCPKKYWWFIRKQQGLMSGGHYDEEFARYDVKQKYHVDKRGNKVEGEHWSMEQARQVMQENGIGGKNTVEDVYVGLNAFWHDLGCDLEENEVIKAAIAFWFKDADFPDKVGKVWWYMCQKMEVE